MKGTVMTGRQINLTLLAFGILFATVGWHSFTSGQQSAAPGQKPAADPNRFEFEVVQSFDAKYQGDSPGHMGKSGGLENRRPHVALGDPVFRGQEKVGVITGLGWSRTHGSLEVEFDPVDDARICVGDEVWLALKREGR
jgi:hypothetical protein